MNPWSIAGLFLALFAGYSLVATLSADVVEDLGQLHDDSDEWSPGTCTPDELGQYISRIPGKPHTESLNTCWDGDKWIYMDGTECYPQRREWKVMPGGLAA